MTKSFNKLIVVLALIMLLVGAYSYFLADLDVQAATPSSPISSANMPGTPVLSPISVDDKIASDTAFLAKLTLLPKIKINTSILSDSAFVNLKDNTVVLEQGVPGRPNPFAPINTSKSDNATPVSLVTTNEATQITDRSAAFNGEVDSSIGATAVTYFEYGPSDKLGKATNPVKQSLIGTFITNVPGLKAKTPYFYRAVAKVGNSLNYGEVISFITN